MSDAPSDTPAPVPPGTAGPPSGDPSLSPPSAPSAPSPAVPKRGFFRRHWLLSTMLLLLGTPSIGLAAYTAVMLNWSYSSGKRAGYVQKISRKGYVCKTWEGTLYTDIAKGFRSDSFSFTVRNDSLARVMESLSGKRVAVDYEQHIGVPTSCFGDTEYFVTGVAAIPE
jgi:hypothetical protein